MKIAFLIPSVNSIFMLFIGVFLTSQVRNTHDQLTVHCFTCSDLFVEFLSFLFILNMHPLHLHSLFCQTQKRKYSRVYISR